MDLDHLLFAVGEWLLKHPQTCAFALIVFAVMMVVAVL